MVKHLHLPHEGLSWRRLCSRGAVEDPGEAESTVSHVHVVRAGATIELTKPAGIKSEALAGGYVYLGDEAGALVFGVLRDQVLGRAASSGTRPGGPDWRERCLECNAAHGGHV